MELIDMFMRTHEEIERLHIKCVSAPWFQTYMNDKLVRNASTFNPAFTCPAPAPAPRARSRVVPPSLVPPSVDSMGRIQEAMAMSQNQAPVGNYEYNLVQAPTAESLAPASVLADIETLQETVKAHGARMTGPEPTLSVDFDAMLKRIDKKFDATTTSPVRGSGPPRRSFGPRRNLQDVTCCACGQKGHYARDCKGASFSTLPSRKQEEIAGGLTNMPIGDFTTYACRLGTIRSKQLLPKPRRLP